jgi:hypothetical protein
MQHLDHRNLDRLEVVQNLDHRNNYKLEVLEHLDHGWLWDVGVGCHLGPLHSPGARSCTLKPFSSSTATADTIVKISRKIHLSPAVLYEYT